MTKLDYILSLNGRCPEGMEVEKFLAGGCVKCAKKAAAKAIMSCGGKAKKRITKAQDGKPLPLKSESQKKSEKKIKR